MAIKILNENNEKELIFNENQYTFGFSNGMGELINSKREYKKEIVIFNKYKIVLETLFKDEEPKIIINTNS